jgi:preprotein translocase subunit YajC
VVAGAVTAVVAVGAAIALGAADGGSSSGVAASASAAADAEQPASGVRGRGTAGTVASTDGSTLEVETEDGTVVKVSTGDDTIVTEVVDGTVQDLELGTQVRILGEQDGDTVLATAVISSGDADLAGPGAGTMTPPDGMEPPERMEPPEGMEPPTGSEGMAPPQGGSAGPGGGTGGEILEIGDDQLTIATADGETVTVAVTADTTVSITEQRSVGDIVEGDSVVVMGEAGDAGVAATSIRIGELGFGGFPGGAMPGREPSTGADDQTQTTGA